MEAFQAICYCYFRERFQKSSGKLGQFGGNLGVIWAGEALRKTLFHAKKKIFDANNRYWTQKRHCFLKN